MASFRYSAAEESEDTLNSFTSHTGYEPNLLTFGELNDSSVPFSFMIPSTDQDVDDVTLGKMLTAAHRGQVDYCVPGGMSVSQSSSSVMFDGSGQPDEREGPPSIWDTHGISGNVFADPLASSSAPYPQELHQWNSSEEPLHSSTVEKSERPEQNQDLRCQSGPSAKDSVIFS